MKSARQRSSHNPTAILDTAIHDLRTGRFERSLSALTAAGAAITAGFVIRHRTGSPNA